MTGLLSSDLFGYIVDRPINQLLSLNRLILLLKSFIWGEGVASCLGINYFFWNIIWYRGIKVKSRY